MFSALSCAALRMASLQTAAPTAPHNFATPAAAPWATGDHCHYDEDHTDDVLQLAAALGADQRRDADIVRI